MTLSQTLDTRITALIEAYENLQSENSMLRDELQVAKARLAEQELALLAQDGSSNIKESEIAKIIEKLETALGKN